MSSESIYNLLPREEKIVKKREMYRSDWDPDRVYPGSTFGCNGTTRLVGAGKVERKVHTNFGPQQKVKELTSTYTLARTKKATEPSPHKLEKRLPALPKKEDEPIYGLTSNKNFVTTNAVEAILKVPKTKKPEPNYLEKEDYGKVPGYLQVVKEEIQMEKEMVKQYIEQQMGNYRSTGSGSGSGSRDSYDDSSNISQEIMSENERSELIRALKIKWGNVNNEYQKLTHLVKLDTLSKMRRKEQLEDELKSLEANILKLEKANQVIIRDR